jgi:hypothetical protein
VRGGEEASRFKVLAWKEQRKQLETGISNREIDSGALPMRGTSLRCALGGRYVITKVPELIFP